MGPGEDNETGQWVIDSSASFHCTSDPNLLHDYFHMEKPYTLGTASGEVLTAVGRGSVNTKRYKIPDVLFIPGQRKNIISTSKLIGDHRFSVKYDGAGHCSVMDKTGQEVGRAHDNLGMYVVDHLLIGKDVVDASLHAEVSQEPSQAKDKVHEGDSPVGSQSSMHMDGDIWVLDCCAWRHHTSNVLLLDGIDAPPSWGDDDDQITRRVFVRTECFEVPDVRYVQGDARNVISVAQLARSHGLVTVFEPTTAYVRDAATEEEVGRARLQDGVYVLDYLRIRQRLDAVLPSLAPHKGTDELHSDVSKLKLESPEKESWFGMSRSDSPMEPTVVDVFTMSSSPYGEQEGGGTRSKEFYMDSGACQHMTWNGHILKAYHDTLQINPPIESVTRVINSGSSRPLNVEGIGYIDSEGGSLDRVLLVPDSTANLVSVSQLTKDHSARVVFQRDVFWIEELERKERIGLGQQVGNNYVVTDLDVAAGSIWVLDTFALHHHTANRKMLYEFQHTDGDLESAGADQLQILGHGLVRTERFKVPGVRYTEGDARNVVSVAQLADDHGLVTEFQPKVCYVKHYKTEQIVGKGHLANGAYVLDYLRINQDGDDASLHPDTGVEEIQEGSVLEVKHEIPDRERWFGMSRSDRVKDDTTVDVILMSWPSDEDQGCAAPHDSGTQTKEFFLDSGVCHHVTWNGQVLKQYHTDLDIKPPTMTVTHQVSSELHLPLAVAGIGYIDSNGGSLDRVLFVPGTDVNLISISQLTEDYSGRVVFCQDQFWIEKLQTKETIGYGHRDGAKYILTRLDVGAVSDWVLDSFALLHHTPNRQMLYDLQEKAEDLLPTGENQMHILGHGSVCTEWFKVPDVGYIAQGTRNVISVSQLACDHGLVIVFGPTFCYVKHKETGKIVGQGRLCDGIYVLYSLRVTPDREIGERGRRDAAGSSYRRQGGGGASGGHNSAGGGDSIDGNIGAGGGGSTDGNISGGGGDASGGSGRGGGGRDDDNGDDDHREDHPAEEEEEEEEQPHDDMVIEESLHRHVYYLSSNIPRHATPVQHLLVGSTYRRITHGTTIECMLHGTPLRVVGEGDIHTGSIQLENVLHVPELWGNFVSVGDLSKQLRTQVRACLQIHEQTLRSRANAGLPESRVNNFALPLQGMGVPWILVDQLARQLIEAFQAQPQQQRQIYEEELTKQIQAMRVPLVWINNVRLQFQQQHIMEHSGIKSTGQEAQLDWLHQTILHRSQMVEDFISKLPDNGWQLLRSGTLSFHLRDMGLLDSLTQGLVWCLEGFNAKQFEAVDTFARQLQHLGVPQPLVDVLAHQLKSPKLTEFWIDHIADHIDIEVPLGTGPFEITVGKQVLVGNGRMSGDGVYLLDHLHQCPPLRLSYWRDVRSNTIKWALTPSHVGTEAI